MVSKKQTCPFCNKHYTNKMTLHGHIESQHGDQLPQDMPIAQYLFNIKYKKTSGSCIMCKRPTEWNPKSEKYERLCGRDVCSKNFREMFKKRMKKVYNKEHLLNDPEVQKKMLASRRISGEYTWENGHKTPYVGSYEKSFLSFLETVVGWDNPEGVLMPAPFVLKYTLDDKEHFYIPDVFIPSLGESGTIVEIKASAKNNTHSFRQREQASEKKKDEAALKSGYNYFKIEDNNFKEFLEFIHSQTD